jgi:cytochrome P450
MRETARAVTAKWTDEELVAISDATFEISLAVIVRVVLGDHACASDMAARVAAVMRLANTGTAFVDGTGAARVRFDAAVSALDDSLAQIVDDARKHADASGGILGLLVATRDQDGERLSAAELRDQLVTLLIAGHETTATAIAWAMHLLHANPEVLARLREDLDRLGPSPTVEQWGPLPFLDAVCHETLRIRPVVPIVSRFLTAPLDLGTGRLIPEGVFVTPSPYLAHHRAEVFAEPEEFRPERFLDHRFAPYEYLPFGGGGRRCLGSTFALQEMKITLASLLTDFDFEPKPDEVVRPMRRSITVGPSNLRMKVHRRLTPDVERN